MIAHAADDNIRRGADCKAGEVWNLARASEARRGGSPLAAQASRATIPPPAPVPPSEVANRAYFAAAPIRNRIGQLLRKAPRRPATADGGSMERSHGCAAREIQRSDAPAPSARFPERVC